MTGGRRPAACRATAMESPIRRKLLQDAAVALVELRNMVIQPTLDHLTNLIGDLSLASMEFLLQIGANLHQSVMLGLMLTIGTVDCISFSSWAKWSTT